MNRLCSKHRPPLFSGGLSSILSIVLAGAVCTGTANAEEVAPAVEPQPVTGPGPAADADLPRLVLFEPRSVSLGPLAVTPRLSYSRAYNDNVNLTQEALVASHVETWSPSVTVGLARTDDRYELSLRGERIRFRENPANNVRNVEGSLDAVHSLDERSALAWRAAAQDWHEDVGNSALGELSPTPNRFLARVVGGVWRRNLGEANDGSQRLEAELSLSRKTYLNHRETARAGDVTTRGAVLRYLQASGSDRRWLGELRTVDARYSLWATALDNRDTRWLVGHQWESSDDAPAALSGFAKFGLQTKRFDRLRPAYAGVTWELGLQWRPRATTLWELGSSRAAADAPGDQSNRVLQRQDGLGWTEAWSQTLRTTLSFSGSRQRHHYPGGTWRQDRVTGFDVGFRHDLARQLQWGWTHSGAKRRSSVEGAAFARRVDTLFVEFAW